MTQDLPLKAPRARTKRGYRAARKQASKPAAGSGQKHNMPPKKPEPTDTQKVSVLSINNNTAVSLGLVIAMMAGTTFGIFKAGQILQEFSTVQADIVSIKVDLSRITRVVSRLDPATFRKEP